MCLGVWHDVLSRCLMMCHNVQWAFGFGFVHPIGVIYDHLSRDLSSRIQVTVAWTAFLIPSTPYPRQGRPTRYTSLSLRKGLPVATPEFLAAPVSKRATLASLHAQRPTPAKANCCFNLCAHSGSNDRLAESAGHSASDHGDLRGFHAKCLNQKMRPQGIDIRWNIRVALSRRPGAFAFADYIAIPSTQ